LFLSFRLGIDFVIPKLFKTKRYVICPMIDMTNHNSRKARGEVAFEYFGNTYSLATTQSKDDDTTATQPNEQLYISYGTRSNDQLLQYYGFVESNNPHDVYIMPSIREWDINALESVCGRPFQKGRLQKLDDAGLLGSHRMMTVFENDGDDYADDEEWTTMDGVVLSRNIGLDPAILQALRVLVSSDDEWNAAEQAIGNFSVERSDDNERCALTVAITAIEMELAAKPTTIEEDQAFLQRFDTMKQIIDSDIEARLVLQFRIEKKKLLKETIERLQKDLDNRN
jgi:Rubisco LSMT substrate-binding